MSVLEEIFFTCIMIMLIAIVICGLALGLVCFSKLVLKTLVGGEEDAVKHGQWKVECKDRKKCSICGFGRNTETQMGWNFCPNCGARMDGDGNA